MYCPELNILFIHIPKTAGTSIIQYFLSLQCKDWKKRKHRNHFFISKNGDPLLGPPQTAHFTLEEYRTYPRLDIPPNWTEQAFKFTVVRNPFDRLWSEYNFNRKRHKPAWDDFCTKEHLSQVTDNYLSGVDGARHLLPQHMFFSTDDEVQILRFENIAEDFAMLLQKLRLPQKPLPHMNKQTRDNYVNVYDCRKLRVVKELYEEDFVRFGYAKTI